MYNVYVVQTMSNEAWLLCFLKWPMGIKGTILEWEHLAIQMQFGSAAAMCPYKKKSPPFFDSQMKMVWAQFQFADLHQILQNLCAQFPLGFRRLSGPVIWSPLRA